MIRIVKTPSASLLVLLAAALPLTPSATGQTVAKRHDGAAVAKAWPQQAVRDWMRLGMDAQAAVNAPRFHHQWFPNRIRMEAEFPESMEQALGTRGHDVERGWNDTPSLGHEAKRRKHMGLVNAIGIDPQTNERLGAADPRDEGVAAGY